MSPVGAKCLGSRSSWLSVTGSSGSGSSLDYIFAWLCRLFAQSRGTLTPSLRDQAWWGWASHDRVTPWMASAKSVFLWKFRVCNLQVVNTVKHSHASPVDVGIFKHDSLIKYWKPASSFLHSFWQWTLFSFSPVSVIKIFLFGNIPIVVQYPCRLCLDLGPLVGLVEAGHDVGNVFSDRGLGGDRVKTLVHQSFVIIVIAQAWVRQKTPLLGWKAAMMTIFVWGFIEKGLILPERYTLFRLFLFDAVKGFVS